MKKFLCFLVSIAYFLEFWEIISRAEFVSLALFPPPSKVAIALWEMIITGVLFSDLYASLWRLAIGLFLGSVSGIFFGLATGRIKSFASIFTPIIQILRPLPPVAIIPLVIVWFGIDDGAKIFSIAFAVFFPVWINTHIGAEQVPQIFLQSTKLLTKSKNKIFFKVIFPASLPFSIAGIRIGIAIGFIMVFVSELAGASSGLGYRISIAHLSYRIDEMIAVLAVLGALGAITDQLFVFGINRLYPWINLSSK